ncbi:MAG TPA: dihydrolipoyl dehydrogenase [bacterium]|jgi:dihydrolipoamide dehydrogenase
MKTFDVVIIGGGPAGYVAAIRSAQLEMTTAIIEKSRLGGMCLNWGCVPSRRLMESARLYRRFLSAGSFGIEGADPDHIHFNWQKSLQEKDKIVTRLVKGVEFLMKKNRVEVISGEGRLLSNARVEVNGEAIGAGKIIIATGSRPNRAPLAQLPDALVMEIDQLYSSPTLPDNIVVVGGDVVACETASLLSLLGKKVTMVASQERLVPWMDDAIIKFVTDRFKKDGIRVLMGSPVPVAAKGGIKVGSETIACDLVLNASRRTAILPDFGDVPVDLENGFIRVNEFMQTSVPSVYAAGDVTGQIFAHIASAQGACAINHMAGLREPVDYRTMPTTIYMEPEVGSVGLSEVQITDAGTEYVKGEFPMSVNSRAMVEGTPEGFVKMLADQKYGELLGVHIVAEHAGDLIAEAAMCIKTEGTLDDLSRVVHAHPTVSETLLEASFKAMGKPLHV